MYLHATPCGSYSYVLASDERSGVKIPHVFDEITKIHNLGHSVAHVKVFTSPDLILKI